MIVGSTYMVLTCVLHSLRSEFKRDHCLESARYLIPWVSDSDLAGETISQWIYCALWPGVSHIHLVMRCTARCLHTNYT